jgi:hypothetical protein
VTFKKKRKGEGNLSEKSNHNLSKNKKGNSIENQNGRYKRERRRLTPHSCLFSRYDHLRSTTYVLRVLSQETLEASKEVKDSSVPGPTLAKEVQYPSLAIISIHKYSSLMIWRLEHRFEVFSSSGAQLLTKRRGHGGEPLIGIPEGEEPEVSMGETHET